MNNYKKLLIIFIALFFVVSIVTPVFAQEEEPKAGLGFSLLEFMSGDTKKCQFKQQSGLNIPLSSSNDEDNPGAAQCGPTLLAEYMIGLNQFFFRLAIALAVLMIMVGGFQWLMALGSASKISNAKETIQQAVIGLILALTATLLFSQIDSSFTNLNSLNVRIIEEQGDNCGIYFSRGECEKQQDGDGNQCPWTCRNVDFNDPDHEQYESCPGFCGASCETLFMALGEQKKDGGDPDCTKADEQTIACFKQNKDLVWGFYQGCCIARVGEQSVNVPVLLDHSPENDCATECGSGFLQTNVTAGDNCGW